MASFTVQNPVIYTITNLVNGKIYVGYTSDFVTRKSKHLSDLRKGTHRNARLQSAFTRDGEQNFSIEILEEVSKREFLPSIEHHWCNLLSSHSIEFGYNYKPTHPEGLTIHRLESKQKISLKNKGRKRTDQTWVGRIHTDQSKEKMRLAKLGTVRGPHSSETRRKISERNRGKARYTGFRDIPIEQFDLENNFIRVWPSASQAARELNISQGNIAAVLRGKRRMASNFIWKYKTN